MLVSLNEIESLTYKAARGAGLSWGLAEEAAAAARWLAGCGAPWSRPLLAVLSLAGSGGSAALTTNGVIERIDGGDLCPLVAGAYLSDAGLPAAARQLLVVRRVRWPVLLLPFAARLGGPAAAVRLSIESQCKTIDASGGDVLGSAGELAAFAEVPLAAEIRLQLVAQGPRIGDRLGPPAGGVSVDVADWHHLTRLEGRTYVPASEQSRIAGAGAGLSDND